jgi:hypothetical protein
LARWLALAICLALFMLRIVLLQGFYVVAYALWIYLLNLLLLFLTPKLLNTDDNDELMNAFNENFLDVELVLPSTNDQNGSGADGEFRPFVRRLPEFAAWQGGMRAVLLSLGCTLFPFLDIPVFWPVLVMYFILLVAVTLRRQIAHMIKYRYVPFDWGKRRYSVAASGRRGPV